MEHYFDIYFESFVWIIKNAFHKEKIFIDFVPKHLELTFDKEKGRKYIKEFIKNSQVLRKCFKRDLETFNEFFDKYRDETTESFKEHIKNCNDYIYKKLFDDNYVKIMNVNVKYLDDALKYLKSKLK